jgi:cytochrome c5
MEKHFAMIFIVLCVFFFLLSACASAQSILPTPTGITTDIPTQEGGITQGSQNEGKTLLETRCASCHSTERITSSSKTADAWKATVERMISHGAQLNTEEEAILIQYLAEYFK